LQYIQLGFGLRQLVALLLEPLPPGLFAVGSSFASPSSVFCDPAAPVAAAPLGAVLAAAAAAAAEAGLTSSSV